MKRFSAAVILVCLFACDATGEPSAGPVAALSSVRTASSYQPESQEYPFAADSEPLVRLDDAFAPPEGFQRVARPSDGFATWLRGLPLLRDRQTVRAYDGRRLASPSAGVVSMDVGDRDLQQCADSAIRLHAEYLWARNRSDQLAYHFTSGDEVRYSDWVDGERVRAVGSKVTRRSGARRADTHTSMRRWLDLVYRYAGTRSLRRDSERVDADDVRGGDFFVAPGSPGHAVVVLDVAIHPDGRRAVLLGQGFMPAQEFHVLRDPGSHTLEDVWFVLPDSADGSVETPSWRPFALRDLRRFVAE